MVSTYGCHYLTDGSLGAKIREFYVAGTDGAHPQRNYLAGGQGAWMMMGALFTKALRPRRAFIRVLGTRPPEVTPCSQLNWGQRGMVVGTDVISESINQGNLMYGWEFGTIGTSVVASQVAWGQEVSGTIRCPERPENSSLERKISEVGTISDGDDEEHPRSMQLEIPTVSS